MKIFIENCDYFTFTIFKNIEINEISKVLDLVYNSLSKKILFDFNFIKHKLEQTYNGKDKIYFFHPSSFENCVLMVTNKQDGRWSLAHFLSKKLELEFYSVSISDNKTLDPKNEFLFEKNGECIRIIQTMKDTKWIFYEKGEPLWFENLDYYKNRYIKDKLNKKIVIEYCHKLGFEILNEKFWSSKEVLFVEEL